MTFILFKNYKIYCENWDVTGMPKDYSTRASVCVGIVQWIARLVYLFFLEGYSFS